MGVLNFRFRYYQTVAARMGVPDMWTEDAAQDMAIRCWKQGDDRPFRVKSAAIDAARRYGPRTRHGLPNHTESLEHVGKRCPCFGVPY